MRLTDNQSMQWMDRRAIYELEIPSLTLMENAASATLEEIAHHLPPGGRMVIFCGSGNNGGDGYALARLALDQGYSVETVEVLAPRSQDCQIQRRLLEHWQPVVPMAVLRESAASFGPGDLVVDAIFGTGLERPIVGQLADWIDWINQLPCKKLALDLPTGVHGSTGDVLGRALRVDWTISFATRKIGLSLYPGRELAGQVRIKPISIPLVFPPQAKEVYWVDAPLAKSLLKDRSKTTYKNQEGHLLLLAGSKGMMGAGLLAAKAGLRSGTGLATLLVPSQEESNLLEFLPELMTQERAKAVPEALARFSAWVAGCGLGREESFWANWEAWLRNFPGPLVLDADAFYGIQHWQGWDPNRLVITPHAGEFAKISGFAPPTSNQERLEQGYAFVQRYPMTLILKGAPTLIFTPEGKLFINSTGNPGMATAGMGDVLAGLVGGLLARGYTCQDAAVLGVFLHGLAADRYVAENSEESLLAGDVIEFFGKAYTQLRES